MAATINLKVNSDFAAASADLKKFGTIAESERKRIEKFVDSFQTDQIDKFTDKARRNAAAIKATRGPVDALTAEYKQYQRQIETLIRRGLDPESKEIKTLTTRYKALEKEIKDVGKAQAKNQKKMKATQGAMLAIGAGAVLMGKQLVSAFIDFSKESAKAASDAEEIEGKFNVVFANIGDDATAAASQIANDFNLANSTVNKLLGDTGDILTGLGFDQKTALDLSKSVGTLALDLASFTNFAGGAEGASAALTKALLGEAESAKALGIVIRQDTAEYKAMVQEQMDVNGLSLIQAKAMTALAIATEQSKNSLGDYARTMDSTANVEKRLAESTKTIKEEWGRAVNEGLTPLRKAAIASNDRLGALLITSRELQAALARVKDGTGDTADELVVLKQRLDTATGAMNAANSGYAQAQTNNEELIRVRQEQIDVINAEIDAHNKLLLQQQENDLRNKQGAAIQAKIAADRKASDNAFLTLADRIEARRQAGLTSKQKQIELLNIEIERQASARDILKEQGKVWAGVQALVNDLVTERNELQKESVDVVEKEHTAVIAAGEDWLSIEQAKIDHLIWIDGLETEINERRLKEAEKEAAAAKELSDRKIAVAKQFVSSSMGFLSALDSLSTANSAAELQRLKDSGASEEELAAKRQQIAIKEAKRKKQVGLFSVAVDTASAIIGFLTNPGGIPGIALAALAAATGAAQAAAISAAPIPAFAEGGSFTTQGPTPLLVGDNIGGQEHVTVEPVSTTGQNTESVSEGSQGGPMTLMIDGQQFTGWMQSQLDNGNLRVPRRNVIA